MLVDEQGHVCLADFGRVAEVGRETTGRRRVRIPPLFHSDEVTESSTIFGAVAEGANRDEDEDGPSKAQRPSRSRVTIVGDPLYMAPEMIKGDGYGCEARRRPPPVCRGTAVVV